MQPDKFALVSPDDCPGWERAVFPSGVEVWQWVGPGPHPFSPPDSDGKAEEPQRAFELMSPPLPIAFGPGWERAIFPSGAEWWRWAGPGPHPFSQPESPQE